MKLPMPLAALALTACAGNTLPPMATPGPDMCVAYRNYNYSPAAGAVETIDNLRAHTSNEAVFYEKCVAGKQGSKFGGSR